MSSAPAVALGLMIAIAAAPAGAVQLAGPVQPFLVPDGGG
jgi:hypothetical protein